MARSSDPGPGEGWASRQAALMAAAWGRGERIGAAELIARHPDVGSEDAIRLIYEEMCLRRDAGEPERTSEVLRRHPRWAEQLQTLIECDRLLRPSGAMGGLPDVGETIGPFLLLGELGRGASGRTYLATDPGLAGRPVVVKLIAGDGDEHLALAQLRHTHIIPLFSEHTFPERGLRGLCMPYLGGASLDKILHGLSREPVGSRTGRKLIEQVDARTLDPPVTPPADGPFRRAIEKSSYIHSITLIGACLADALQFAHARGMIHMDVKPSNVLIATDGQPMLLDFHLARTPIAAGQTITDRVGGTPGWMSPEQEAAMRAVGRGESVPSAIDGRSDLYALGLLLSDALGLSTSSRRPEGVSRGLADIVGRCLQADPRDRYADAASLADDLRRHLEDRPLRGVRNRDLGERWEKWRRRHPGAAALGIAGVAIAAAGWVAWRSVDSTRVQRAATVRRLLEDGRQARRSGRFEEAAETLRRGLDDARGESALRTLHVELAEELERAERGRLVAGVHALADRIRYGHGIELPTREESLRLMTLCESLWENRGRLLGPSADRGEARSSIESDLLEIVATWIDLRRHAGANEGGESAEPLLQEAEAMLGPSLALDLRRGRDESDRAPATAWEHYDLGRYLLRSGRPDAAIEEFHAAAEARPQDFWSNFYLGLCAHRLGRYEAAAMSFRVSVALRPDAPESSHNLALALDAEGRADEARRAYDRAIAIDPDLGAARLNRGQLAYRSGRYTEAIEDFERGLSGHADTETRARLYYNLALARNAMGDRTHARSSAAEAKRLGIPEAADLLERLSRE